MPLSPCRERPRPELCHKLWKARASFSACWVSWRLAGRQNTYCIFPPSGNVHFLELCELAGGVFPPCIADMASLLWCSLVTETCSTLSTVSPWRMNHRSQGLTGRRKKSCREISDILAEQQQRFSWGSLCTELGQNICTPFLNKKTPSKPNKRKPQQQKMQFWDLVLLSPPTFTYAFYAFLFLFRNLNIMTSFVRFSSYKVLSAIYR